MEGIKKTGFYLSKNRFLCDNKVILLINKLSKFEKTSEVDNMALMGILSSQIIHKMFIKDFNPDYSGIKQFDIVFDLRNNKS